MSLEDVDPEILAVYDKLGIPLDERKAMLGVQEQAVRRPSRSMPFSIRSA